MFPIPNNTINQINPNIFNFNQGISNIPVYNIYQFQYPLSINDFETLETLGKGAHGCVIKARYKKNNFIYAVKEISQDLFNKNDKNVREKDYLREKTILYDLTNRNCQCVAKLYTDFQDLGYRYLVMEYCEGKSLADLTKNTDGYIAQDKIINILNQLLNILHFLHDTCYIIHRDIKPDNIIIDNNNKIKLLDFGLAAYLFHQNNQLVYNYSFKGVKNYVPPEIILYPPPIKYDAKVDIHELGFTMHYIMNKGKLPQETEGTPGNFRRYDIFNNNTIYERWLNAFVHLLYEKEAKKRPTAKEALGLFNKFRTNPNLLTMFKNNNEIREFNINNMNLNFRRHSFLQNNPMTNINNQIFTNIPLMPQRSVSLNNININNFNFSNISNISNDSDINNFQQNKNINRMNSEIIIQRKKTEVDEFLQPNMGKENKIISSMKSLLQIFVNSKIIEYISAQFVSLYSNLEFKEYFIKEFHDIFETVKKFNKNIITKQSYDQLINDFIIKIFILNNSGISGTRPIILFYMMTSIIKDEFFSHFKNYKNKLYDEIIENNYSCFDDLIPIEKDFRKLVEDFRDNYRSPFVDNFYFLLLTVRKFPKCNFYFDSYTQISQFLQLDVPDETKSISDLIKEFFDKKITNGKWECVNCGQVGQRASQKYCLNLPNYLLLEFEDKGKINFTENLDVPLYMGLNVRYKYFAGIYKRRINEVSSFIAVIKTKDSFVIWDDDHQQPTNETSMSLEWPSLAIYEKIDEYK